MLDNYMLHVIFGKIKLQLKRKNFKFNFRLKKKGILYLNFCIKPFKRHPAESETFTLYMAWFMFIFTPEMIKYYI